MVGRRGSRLIRQGIDVGELVWWSCGWVNYAGAWGLLEGGGDGEIMAYVDDTAREGDTLGVVLGGASEDLSCEILKFDRFSDTTRFVEAIHIVEEERLKRTEGLYRALERWLSRSEKRRIRDG
jgi:hypothetical protein